jgi:hypothetical protein
MDLASLAGTIGVSPSLSFSLRKDPSEPRRVILAPDSLLDPGLTYAVGVTQDARDVDGNSLRAGSVVSFSTGQLSLLLDGPAQLPQALGRLHRGAHARRRGRRRLDSRREPLSAPRGKCLRRPVLLVT